MILRPWLTIQAADMFLNNNPKFKPTMSIPAILSDSAKGLGKIPSVFPIPLPNRLSSFPTIATHICR